MDYLIIALPILILLWVIVRMSQQAVKRMQYEDYEESEED